MEKQPKAKQIIRRADEVAKECKARAHIIVDIYWKMKSEEQIYNSLTERFGDNEYVKSFPDFIRRSILDQLIRGYLLSIKF